MSTRKPRLPKGPPLKHPTEDARRAEVRALERVMRLNRQIHQRTRQLSRHAEQASTALVEFAQTVLEREGFIVTSPRHASEREETVETP